MELQIFENEAFGKVRSVMIDNEPWFVAKDVCICLDLTNPTVSLDRLDNDERTKLNLGRQGETNVVNEYGLYNLVLGSRKPEAKSFKRWITHEVIPSIRKTGSYNKPMSQIEILQSAVNELARIDKEVQGVKENVESIKGIVSLKADNWRVDTTKLVNRIVEKTCETYDCIRRESYDILCQRMRVDLKARLRNLQNRLRLVGASESRIHATSYLDVIENDPKLIQGYLAVVKDMAIRYGA